MLKLRNDEEYGKFLSERMAAPKAEIIHDVPEEYQMRIDWYVQAAAAHALNRDYKSAMNCARDALELEMQNSGLLGNCAKYMLALGHPAEAAELAEKAVELAEDSGEWKTMHSFVAKLVMASALAANGEKEKAAAIVAAIDSKDIGEELIGTYYFERCTYFAYADLSEDLNNEMDHAVLNDVQPESWPKGYAMAMFERDVAFDPYRNEDWFIHKVGITA